MHEVRCIIIKSSIALMYCPSFLCTKYVFMDFMCTSDSEYEQKAQSLALLLTLLLPSLSACCDNNTGHDCKSWPPLQQRAANKHYMKILNARKSLRKRPPSFKLSVWMLFYWSKRFEASVNLEATISIIKLHNHIIPWTCRDYGLMPP